MAPSPEQRCAVGIDVGGTNIFAGLVDGTGQLLTTVKRPTPVAEGPAGIFGAMRAMVRELRSRAEGRELVGIGLGMPGLIDRARGLSVFSPNTRFHNVPIFPEFAEFGLPVDVDNDVRAHANGELKFGAGKGVANFILITLGTGIGSGIVLDGKMYYGPGSTAGEIGHITLQPGGPLCGCGKRGCFEAIASGRNIGRRASEAGIASTARELFAKAAAGDQAALDLVDKVAYDLGRGISIYAHLMNPQRVIVGGGVAQAGDLLFAPLRRYAEEESMPGVRGTYEIVPAQFGDEAGIVGSAALIPALTEGVA
ncbi:MAG TPA: ROK family protein [Symbiobacteriaceae bacterium]|nr:ROK family protein [Symbiobacteriaceae bacterium]